MAAGTSLRGKKSLRAREVALRVCYGLLAGFIGMLLVIAVAAGLSQFEGSPFSLW